MFTLALSRSVNFCARAFAQLWFLRSRFRAALVFTLALSRSFYPVRLARRLMPLA
jgi:hypothetical protein